MIKADDYSSACDARECARAIFREYLLENQGCAILSVCSSAAITAVRLMLRRPKFERVHLNAVLVFFRREQNLKFSAVHHDLEVQTTCSC